MLRYLVSSVSPMILIQLPPISKLLGMPCPLVINYIYKHVLGSMQQMHCNTIHYSIRQSIQPSIMDLELVEIRPTNYYMITHKATKQALYLNHESKNFEKEKVSLRDANEEVLGEVWMLVEVNPDRYPNMYEIVHTISTLVLTAEKDYLDIRFGKWKSSQLYFLQRWNARSYPNDFWIKESKDSNKYLFAEDGKVFMKEMVPDEKCVWELSIVHHNKIINRSCYIQYAYSNMVLDVPKASDKPGVAICQYPCNNRFNQRWNLVKADETGNYRIENLKTGMCLDIKGESKKPGTPIIQWKNTGSVNQLWRVEYQGKNIYMIRSAMDPSLLISVKDNSLKECADIVTTKEDGECFWRIVGYIPQ